MEGQRVRQCDQCTLAGGGGVFFKVIIFKNRSQFSLVLLLFFKVFIDPFYYLYAQHTAPTRATALSLVADCSDKPN